MPAYSMVWKGALVTLVAEAVVIEKFGELTGVKMILSTSSNRQEPIVQRPEEAISCFLRTGMDVLVLGDFYTTDRQRNHLH